VCWREVQQWMDVGAALGCGCAEIGCASQREGALGPDTRRHWLPATPIVKLGIYFHNEQTAKFAEICLDLRPRIPPPKLSYHTPQALQALQALLFSDALLCYLIAANSCATVGIGEFSLDATAIKFANSLDEPHFN
jgi:hypothetical protein